MPRSVLDINLSLKGLHPRCRLSTLGSAGLSVNLPSPLEPIELGSFDNGGRHWQITLRNWSGHIPG